MGGKSVAMWSARRQAASIDRDEARLEQNGVCGDGVSAEWKVLISGRGGAGTGVDARKNKSGLSRGHHEMGVGSEVLGAPSSNSVPFRGSDPRCRSVPSSAREPALQSQG
jgi:hypothetical protein